MSTAAAGTIFIVSLIVALAIAYRYFGDYMYRVVIGTKHSRVERLIYRTVGVNADAEQSWGVYARSVLAFSAISILFLYAFMRLQNHLWLALGFPPVTDHTAWNTAVSFTTNTNWQAYSGESTMGHLVQMAGLAVQNFVSAAVGIAVAIALVRGDPNISVAYADLQAPRIARVRGIDRRSVQELIKDHTTGRALGFMGSAAVNVLELNLALDREFG
jgi:potassium-transporting ATPase potassium-binding subunit